MVISPTVTVVPKVMDRRMLVLHGVKPPLTGLDLVMVTPFLLAVTVCAMSTKLPNTVMVADVPVVIFGFAGGVKFVPPMVTLQVSA